MKKIIFLAFIAFNSVALAQSSVQSFKNSYTYEASGNYTKAISALTFPNSESSYSVNLRLGWLYYLKADHLKSKTHYEKAIKLSSNSIEARLGLIYPLTVLNNWDDIITVYKDILTVDNNHTSSHYQLAYIYFVRKKYAEAEKHLKKVLSLYPFDYNSNALLGSVYVKLGKIKEAKVHYTKALEYNPSATNIEKILNGL